MVVDTKVEVMAAIRLAQSAVRNGSLTLSGFLLDATCLGQMTRWKTPLYDRGTPFGKLYPDTKEDVKVKKVTCIKLLDFGSIWKEVFLVLVPSGTCYRRIGLGDTCLGEGSRYYSESVFAKSEKPIVTLI
jgi:hypothetical protein